MTTRTPTRGPGPCNPVLSLWLRRPPTEAYWINTRSQGQRTSERPLPTKFHDTRRGQKEKDRELYTVRESNPGLSRGRGVFYH